MGLAPQLRGRVPIRAVAIAASHWAVIARMRKVSSEAVGTEAIRPPIGDIT